MLECGASGENNHIYYRRSSPGSGNHQRAQRQAQPTPGEKSLNKLSTPQGHMPEMSYRNKSKAPQKFRAKQSAAAEDREKSFRQSLHD